MEKYYKYDEKLHKRKKQMVRNYQKLNLFFTSSWFLIFENIQSLIFWIISIVFPMLSYKSCEYGFLEMQYYVIGLYLVFIFCYDLVILLEYVDKHI